MRTTFAGEIDFICRKVAMCEKWKNKECLANLSPEKCDRALKSVRKLNLRLNLGNSGNKWMLYEEVRVCHDLAEYL